MSLTNRHIEYTDRPHDPEEALRAHGLDPFQIADCRACEGDGGHLVQTSGHIGHETPPERVERCRVCDGYGECEVVELLAEYGVGELVEWYSVEGAA